MTVAAAPSTARSCTGGASDRLRGADPLAASSALDRPEGGFPAPRRTPEDPDYVRQNGGPDLTAAG